MTAKETQTLAALVQKVNDMSVQLDQNTKDTQSIKSTLDNWTGGRQLLVWLFGIAGTVAIIVTTWIGVHKK